MNFNEDTICAIATSLTPSGIGIIRVSGNNSIKIVSNIFVDKNKNNININTTHKIKYGFIYNKEKNFFIDEVLVLTFIAPHSYTAEDVVEIQCHGGPVVLKEILSLIENEGARIAEPGEFTKRAFLNGRIDLSKAEAVADIISSKNKYARLASFAKLKGNLSDKINSYRKELLESIAFIEACLDDPEHLSIDGFKPKLKSQIENIEKNLDIIIKNYDNGKIIKEGINTVILGKPNVGKSSLLNLLLGEERSIVTDIAGTTRDIIKESINLNGLTLNLIDTAGIREDKNLDKVEAIGIDRAKSALKNADLVLLVIDISTDFDENDKSLINLCLNQNKKYIILLNKIDKKNTTTDLDIQNQIKNIITSDSCIIPFSTKTKVGFDTLKDTITNMFINKDLDFNNEIFISNLRQLSSIKSANVSLSNVLKSIEENLSEDFLTIDLTDAYTYLSQVLGIETTDDVINEIFSKFCMGK